MSESLAIIGISCLFPKADDLQAYWRNIKNGVDAITPIPERSHWQVADYFTPDPKAPDRTYAQRGGFISPVDFNPMEFGIAPKDVEATDTTQLLGMMAARQALVDAGYGEKPFPKERTSVILGVTGALELVIPLGARLGHPIWRRALKESGVPENVAEDVVQRISDGYVGWQENSFPGLLGNVAAGRIANRLDLGGTNCVVDAACASSLAALHLAALELVSGRSDMVITGGIDTFNDIFMYMCFSKTPALSPTGDAKPFDRSCDGTILGEGLGMVVLKRLADAERDGDRIYAVIKGIGSASDGRGNAIYAPRSEGQQLALRRAYTEAGVTPDTVELIEAHGTGTKVGDATELQSLTEVFGGARPKGAWVALGSVKSQIGHAKAAAGVAGLIKAALALQHKVLPPTIKVTQPIDEVAPGRTPFYVNTQKRPWLPMDAHPRRAGVSAFGFGGTNFHCVLEEHGSRKEKPGWDGEVEILAFSADAREALRGQLASLPGELAWQELRARAGQSRREFNPAAKFRLLIPVSRDTVLASLRDAGLAMLDKHPEKAHWTLPNGIAFGTGARRGKLGALFPGQGSQYVGMFRDLACQFPALLDALEAADRAFARERGEAAAPRLSDFIYPHPAFSDEARQQQEAALKSTDVAQPALGAMGLGALGLLACFGVAPEAAAGHSYGELLALCSAGRLTPGSLHSLSNVRGRLMASRNGNGDRGSMLAVSATEEVVVAFLKEEKLDLVIANRNSPNQFVLAGAKAQIEQAAGALAKQSVRARVLPVSAAFHSPLVADARVPFAGALEKVRFGDGTIPVFANSTAQVYPSDEAQARELLAGQIIKPVNFMEQIKAMHANGITTFVEVGPGHVLSDLVQTIIPGGEIETVALDASKGKRAGVFDLAAALCRLAALGHAVDLSRWEEPVVARKPGAKASLTIPLTGANHRSPSAPRPPAPPMKTASLDSPVLPQQRIVPQASPSSSPQSNLKTGQPTAGGNAALQAAQQGILALQKMQEETARLHRQFLESQEAARRTLENLLNQRRELLGLPVGEISRPDASVILPSAPSVIEAPVSQLPVQRPLTSAFAKPMADRPALSSGGGAGVSAARASEVLLSVVAEKTGYPVEMLNLDMGMDSDLGVDSIKRVEIMAAIRAKLPNAPEVKPEHLGTLQTLRQVVEFLTAGAAPSPLTSAFAKPMADRPPFSPGGGEGVSAARASEVLLGVVAEKTGYPVEMLNLDMGMDSDLGVDSIKRVEIMAAIRSQLPGAPEIKPEHLGTLQTLRQVVDFLTAGQTPSPLTATLSPGGGEGVNAARASEVLLGVVAEKTGYPVEMLNLDMGMDSDLGVDSIKRVEIMAAIRSQLPGAPEIKPEHLGTLQTLRQVVDFLTAGAATSPLTSAFAKPTADRPALAPGGREGVAPAPVVQPAASALHRQVVRPVSLSNADARPKVVLPAGACIWITEDGSELAAAVAVGLQKLGYIVRRGSPAELMREQELPSGLAVIWPAARGNDAALKEAFQLIQAAGPFLRKAGGVLVTVSRLDGVFGFGSLNGNGDPVSGGLAGLAKTARHEWPEVNCKAIDLDAESGIGPETADFIVEEMFRAGPMEVGISRSKRYGLTVETVALDSHGKSLALQPEDLVVVTGGARGITALAALQLARLHRPRLLLLGRSQLAASEPEWLAGLTSEAEIKRALAGRGNGKTSPKQLEARYRDVMAQREIRGHLRQIEAAGATVHYRTVDVRDGEAMANLFVEIRRDLGPVRGLVHGAGVLADRRIEDKTDEQFDRVYGTKVDGLRNLLLAVADDDLKLLALFSSYTGRFGRTGQVDYAAANEVLNKIAQSESRRRPQCRVVSFNWGPWNGGMVTPGLRKVFEAEGVGLIEPEAGAEFFAREIAAEGGQPVEILVLARVGNVDQPEAAQVMVGAEAGYTVSLEREVSVKTTPCLASHVLNGRAVLPAALMLEWLAQGAVQGNPGLVVHGVENFKVLKGLVLEPDGSVHVSVLAAPGIMHDGLLRAPVQLVSQSGARQVLHARAEAILAEALPAVPAGISPEVADKSGGTQNVYEGGHLFHGPHFQSIEAVEANTVGGIAALVKSAPAPRQWIEQPWRSSWLTDPQALDSSFQMMILWTWQHRGAASLPCAIRRFRQFADFPKNGSRVVIHVDAGDSPVVTANLHFFDRQGRLLALAEGYECVVDAGLKEAFRLNQLPA